MKEKPQERYGVCSQLFLAELTAAIFLFILCVSQCILAFAVSERISRRTRDLNQAVVMAQAIVEVWKAQGEEGLAEMLLFSKEMQEKEITAYWTALNERWEPVEKTFFDEKERSMCNMARIEIHRKEGLSEAVVTMSNGNGASEVTYQGKAAELLPDSGGRVVFVLRAGKYEDDSELEGGGVR